VFEGKKIERKTPMYWRCNIAPGEFKVCLRQGDWTILANEPMTRFELYNLKKDPKQATNLAATEAAKLEQMRALLVSLNTEIEKEGPTWWRGYEEKKKKPKGK
jgi:arylsulfatase A-like enzyme